MARAGVEAIDKDGNESCIHSLRNSYIAFLANSQTAAKVIQKLARHSDPRLTFNTYARTFAEAEQKAVAFLPNFGDFVLSTSLDKTLRNYADLRELVKHWPKLPESVRAEIKALVQTHIEGKSE